MTSKDNQRLNKPEKIREVKNNPFYTKVVVDEQNRTIDEMDVYYKQFIKEYIQDNIPSAEVIFDYIMDVIEKRATIEESANDLHKLIKERLWI